MRPARSLALSGLLLWLSSCGPAPGYSAQRPTQITCGCHDGASCYDGAAQLAKRAGETDESAEELMYYAQCACFQGSMAGCNTLSHYAKDWVRACEQKRDVKNSCAIAGFVYKHGTLVPRLNGRSFDHDPAAASAAFRVACEAGSALACAEIQ